LRYHHVTIAPSTYYAFKKRPPSARQQSDELLLPVLREVHRLNYDCYGVRKLWQALKHQRHHLGRDQVARLMRLAGLRGKTRLRRIRTTLPDPIAERFPDLVRRAWDREAPDLVWLADFTHVSTRQGTVYTSFLQDGFNRHILGFTVATTKSAELVTKALEQAISVRRRSNPLFTSEGIIHHSDAGSQYTSLAFSQKLLDLAISGSIGRVGTAYDNALMESTIGLYKTELIHADRRVWTSRQEVETATLAWVNWFNQHRLHSALGYVSPIQFEAAYNQNQALLRQAA
jgi:putative transposase